MNLKQSLVLVSLSTLLLASCSGIGKNQPSPEDAGNPPSADSSPRDRGDRGHVDDGSGMMRSGSGAMGGRGGMRFGSGGMSAMMGQLSESDRALFQQMMDARKSGNTTLADQIRAQLKEKYPNLRFGSGSRNRSESGTSLPSASETPIQTGSGN